MKFKKIDLFATVEMLREAQRRGYTHVVSPRDRSQYGEKDIYALPSEKEALEFAALNGDWYSEPLERILRDLSLVADRYDLGEIAHVFRDHELGFRNETLADDLKAMGVHHPMLERDLMDDFGAEFISITVGVEDREAEIHLYPKVIDGKLRVTDFSVVVDRDYGHIEQGEHKGIDSRELERQFAEMDWNNHAGGKVISNDRKWFELMAQAHIYCDHGSREEDPEYYNRLLLVNSLMAKYIKGTDMERDLFAFDKSSMGIFYDTVMFPRDIKIALVAKRIDEPDLLRELSEQAYLSDNQKTLVMNLNNLENLREEMANLGFKKELIEQMEEKMKANVADFKLYDSVEATRGRVDMTLFFKQSGQSDYYYLNKFEVCYE
ncbi:MAG: hypothetical protein EOO88_30050, partial [Pedobacter sp.]